MHPIKLINCFNGNIIHLYLTIVSTYYPSDHRCIHPHFGWSILPTAGDHRCDINSCCNVLNQPKWYTCNILFPYTIRINNYLHIISKLTPLYYIMTARLQLNSQFHLLYGFFQLWNLNQVSITYRCDSHHSHYAVQSRINWTLEVLAWWAPSFTYSVVQQHDEWERYLDSDCHLKINTS